MLKIKPSIEFASCCELCKSEVTNERILWQGIHVSVITRCRNCQSECIEDLSVGHATYSPYKVILPDYQIIGDPKALKWLGQPFKNSLQAPSEDIEINIDIKKNRQASRVIIINCIDYLYGHSLLKLLNAEREKDEHDDLGIVVITQKALEWMVPEFVSEVWTVNIPFSKARNYYPLLDKKINKELERFEEIYVSHAYSHPDRFNIENFTRIAKYNPEHSAAPRVTFVWRDDRLWSNNYYISKVMQKYPSVRRYLKPLLYIQKRKVIRLFKRVRSSCPQHKFTVAGLGKTGKFPDWISDERVKSFNKDNEVQTCRVYSESRVVIGVHGSNMLLPSAHAGMTIDLMPMDRWGNFAQDILFQESNNRLTSYKYRLIPIETRLPILAKIITYQITGYQHYSHQMTEGIRREAALQTGVS